MNPDLVNFLSKAGEKIADYRYNAAETVHNQPIEEVENFGYIPIRR